MSKRSTPYRNKREKLGNSEGRRERGWYEMKNDITERYHPARTISGRPGRVVTVGGVEKIYIRFSQTVSWLNEC